MVFSTVTFLFVFLPAVLAVYFLAPRAGRNLVLVAASLLFYAWAGPKMLLLLLGSCALNYVCALAMERLRNVTHGPPAVLAIGVAANVSLLGYVKYAGFFGRIAGQLAGQTFRMPEILLPAGISFFTFLGLSYLVDVYRQRTPALRNPLHVVMYMGEFPTVMAGPITRYEHYAPQIKGRAVSLPMFAEGVERFVIGLAKKAIIATALAAIPAEVAKGSLQDASTATAWISAVAFTGQIYFDFSGYSDMAIGLGRMFGFRFPENFDYPYTAASISEFWRRWHITLGAWFREYVYIPLGGSRVGEARLLANLFAVWLLTGLWHGAAWHFVAWGVYYGILIAIEKLVLRDRLELVWRPLRHLGVMLLVIVGWVIFSAPGLRPAFAQLSVMAGMGGTGLVDAQALHLLAEYRLELLIAVVASLPLVPYLRRRFAAATLPAAPRLALAYSKPVLLGAMLHLSVVYMISGSFTPFLYFKF